MVREIIFWIIQTQSHLYKPNYVTHHVLWFNYNIKIKIKIKIKINEF